MKDVVRPADGLASRRVEVAGCIACGKTTLVRALEGRVAGTIFEDHAANPFWSSFFVDPAAHAFETEISFLLQHYHFAKEIHLGAGGVVVMDHSFELDMAYAAVGLRGSRRSVFDAIYDEIRAEIGAPRSVVFVRCSAEEAFRRVRARARPGEENISLAFLEHLVCELERRIATLAAETPLVCIDSAGTDFRSPGTWVDDLLRRVGVG